MDDLLGRLSIVRVTCSEENKNKVLSIRKPEDVYGGNDYLPFCYNRMINQPNSRSFAAVLDKTFIAFAIVNIFDDGETYILRAVRVSTQYEGCGVIRWFLDQIQTIISKEFPSVRFCVSTTIREDETAIRRVKEGRYYTVADREMVDFDTNKETLPDYLITDSCETLIKTVTETDLTGIFENTDIVNTLFGKKIVVNWITFRPIKSNAPYILHETSSVLCSNITDKNRMLMTFGLTFESINGTFIFIDVYGNIKENLKFHIQQHVQKTMQSVSRNHEVLIIRLFYDKGVCHSFIENLMTELGFFGRPLPVSGCWCLETKL